MHTVARALTILFVTAIITSCSEEDKKPTAPTTPPSVDPVSEAVSTGSSATIENDAGVRLYVSPNSVPAAVGGGDGTLVFSIEQTSVSGASAPPGARLEGNPMQFGPEDMTFAQPVQLSFAAPADTTRQYMLARLDRETDRWMIVPTLIDEDDPDRLIAHTTHLSTWGMFGVPQDPRAAGRIHFVNASSNRWVSVCVDTYELAYPEWQGFFDPSSVGTSLSAAGHLPGVTSDAHAIVPQGTWTFLATRTEVVDPVGVAYADGWINIGTYTVNQPGGPGQTVTLSPDSWTEVNMEPLWAPCLGTPTPPAGTGVIQITLSWGPIVDLDLHVIDPAGEEIYYLNRDSESGGHLDRDTICSLVDRRPENVFWGDSAPAGTYQVKVHFYGDCDTGTSPVDFQVRRVVDGVPRTFDGSVTEGQTVDVTTFTR